MSGYPIVRLSDVATYRKEFITVDDSISYKRCRVQLHRKGVVLRDEVTGKDIKTKRQRVCQENDFLVAEMDAKFGGYGLVPPDLVGAVVSSHYYLFKLDSARISPEYLSVLIDTDVIQRQIQAKGSTNYSRISPVEVAAFEIPCPPLSIQQQIVRQYGTSKATLNGLLRESDHQSSLLTQLRQAILQEAIEGKLTAGWRREHPVVKGDPETDAAALLAQIGAEKARLVAEGKIKKPKPLAPIREDEVPFALPEGWVWTRLGAVTSLITSGSRNWKDHYSEVGFPLIRSQDIKRDRLEFEDRVYVEVGDGVEGDRTKVQKEDCLLTITGGNLAKCARLQEPLECAFVSQHVALIRPAEPRLGPFLHKWLTSERGGRGILLGYSYGDKPGLNLDQLNRLPIPLPPLAEQRVIVEKIERLLALVEDLERQVVDRKRQAEALLQTVLAEAFGEAPT